MTTPTPDSVEQGPVVSSNPTAGLQASDRGEESWIYRMATDTKRQFQSQTTPISTPTPQIDTDMSALNEALEDLGKLRLRADLTQGKVSLTITPEEAKQCLEAFFEMMDTLVVPGVFATTLDVNLLRSLPYIIGSPLVNIDPGVHVMYFAAIHYGLTQTRGTGHILAHTAYLKALEHVPAWLEAPTETDMDGYTAAISAWVAVNNLDYQLSWRFHLKACHYLKSKGIDNLDGSPAKTLEEEEKRESTRYLFWQVLATDCLYRLFWGKPTVVCTAVRGLNSTCIAVAKISTDIDVDAMELEEGQAAVCPQPAQFASEPYPSHADMCLDKLHISDGRTNRLD